MRIFSWNIRHGGTREVDRLVDVVEACDPDVVVLLEWRVGRRPSVERELADRGWPHCVTSDPAPKVNGVMIASKTSIAESFPVGHRGAPEAALLARFDQYPLTVVGYYNKGLPETYGQDLNPPLSKRERWEESCRGFVANVGGLLSEAAVLIGDFNDGLPDLDVKQGTYPPGVAYLPFLDDGWVNLFRALHPAATQYSWWSRTRSGERVGWLLDQALGSPLIAPLIESAEYLSSVGDELLVADPSDAWFGTRSPLSDHSALVVDLALPVAHPYGSTVA